MTPALEWLRDFERADVELSDVARVALRGSVTMLARELELAGATPEKIVQALTTALPALVVTSDPEPIIEGLIAFLIWAVKRNRIRDRRVEYTCRKIRHEAAEAMRDERKWSTAKQIIMAAMRDGVEPTDLRGVREHALSRGMGAAFVDEFVYPQPTCLPSGRWLWLDEDP